MKKDISSQTDSSKSAVDVLNRFSERNSQFNEATVFDKSKLITHKVFDHKVRLFRIRGLTYEKDFPRQKAFENVVSSTNISGIDTYNCRFFYYLKSATSGVEFYIGAVTDASGKFTIGDYADILTRSFKGNFLGSQLEELNDAQAQKLCYELRCSDLSFSTLIGVPTKNKEHEDAQFQGADRLVNIMTSSQLMNNGKLTHERLNFHLLVIWEPVNAISLDEIEGQIQDIYTRASLFAKASTQYGTNSGTQYGTNKTTSTNQSTSSNRNKSSQGSTTYTEGTSNSSRNKSTANQEGWSTSEGFTQTSGTTESSSENVSTSNGESLSHTTEIQNKRIQDGMQYIDKELLPRIRLGKAQGMFKTAIYVGAETKLQLQLLQNSLMTICQGDTPTFVPLKPMHLDKAFNNAISCFEIINYASSIEDKPLLRLNSRLANDRMSSLSSVLTASEISLLAGMPLKEVPGLELREQVPFGLNPPAPDSGQSLNDEIELGNVMQEGSILNNSTVSLKRSELTKHVFIAGTTGSGKTTTCHKILASAGTGKPMPFLVIEPAKTEYRSLIKDRQISEVTVFTLGNEKGVPFRFNPFEFLENEGISGHIDNLKACFMASFDMDAAIPNLLEEGLYRVYEKYGWDITTDENRFLTDRSEAWRCGGRFFPTITDYIKVVLNLVDDKHFDERLEKEYKGSIRARLDSLCVGTKGLMLNTRLSVDFKDLIKRNVILELEEIKSGEDKAFLMGLILSRLSEVLKEQHRIDPAFKHITLVEEAHRLLSAENSTQNSTRRHGVEIFSDMLAEVRKYGECLVIVDQIPSKLASEVLKNTNTKIIHKLFSADDKKAVGNTMMLNDKQQNYLSNLMPGEAVIFSQGWKKPVDVQIIPLRQTSTSDADIPEEDVHKNGWQYWKANPVLFCRSLAGCHLAKKPLDDVELKKISYLEREFQNALKNAYKDNLISATEKIKQELGDDDSIVLLSNLLLECFTAQEATGTYSVNETNRFKDFQEFSKASHLEAQKLLKGEIGGKVAEYFSIS